MTEPLTIRLPVVLAPELGTDYPCEGCVFEATGCPDSRVYGKEVANACVKQKSIWIIKED